MSSAPAPQAPVPSPVSSSSDQPGSLVRAAWARWKKMAHAIGVVQTRILMVLFYFTFVVPLGLVLRMTGDRLRLKPPKGSNWTPHSHREQSVEAAQRQF